MSRTVTAIDTNVLLYALNGAAPEHAAARAFLTEGRDDPDIVISELVLVELYLLLRNPAVIGRPLSAEAAARVVETFRRHPAWQVVDHDPEIMGELWRRAARKNFARRRIFDLRLGLGLVRRGVTRFATRNVGDFQNLGFDEVFDPIAG